MHSFPPIRSSPRGSRWEWAQAALLAGTLAWCTLGLGGHVPATMVVTAPLVGALMVVHLLERVAAAGAVPRVHPAGWLLLPFLGYAALNAGWVSPVPWLGWIDWFWWAEMFVVFWVALNGLRTPAARQLVFFTLVALALINVFLGCYQRFVNPDWLMLGRLQSPQFYGRPSGSFGNPNSLAAFLVLLLPAAAALVVRRRARATARVWWGWVTLVLAFGLVLPISRGAWIALGMGLTLWPLFAGRGGLGRRVLLASGVFALVLLGSAIVIACAPKVRQRFVQMAVQAGETSRPILWRASWELFTEAPVLGTGAGSFNLRFEAHRPEGFRDEPQWAHNEYLNTLADYGAVGALLLFGAGLAIAVRCALARREPGGGDRDWLDAPAVQAGIGIGLLAFALHLSVDYHLKIPALAMTFATLAAFVARAWPAPAPRPVPWSGQRAVALLLALACAGAVGLVFTPAFHAEALRYRARRAIDRLAIEPPAPAAFEARLRRARADLARAVAVDSCNGQAWADLSYATALWGAVERDRAGALARDAESTATRALAVGRVAYEFWIRRGVARDMQGRWLDAGDDFTQALRIAPRNAYAWYHHAEHLSRKPSERKLSEAALAFCLRLDPGNPPGLALRQRLAISTKVP